MLIFFVHFFVICFSSFPGDFVLASSGCIPHGFFENWPLPDKICMMMTRLACNQAIESSYWRMDNNSDVGLLTGYVLYRLPIELEFMDLDTFSR
jgi:hypothetical protein